MAYGHGCHKHSPRPGEGTPKGGAHVLALCTTPGQLAYFVALALQQHGQQSALCKGRRSFSHHRNLSISPCPKDSVIYPVGEYSLAVFSERLTVSCRATSRLGKRSTTRCGSSIPTGSSQTAIAPPATRISPNCSAFLTG